LRRAVREHCIDRESVADIAREHRKATAPSAGAVIDVEFAIAADCAVAPEEIHKRVEALVIDAIADDVQRRLAAYIDPATGERATLAITGSLRDGLDLSFGASSLDLVELVRARFSDYAPLKGGTLAVRVAGSSLGELRFAFSGAPALVELIERRLARGPLGAA
jgi:hypothetical protein